jgi:hypothetical protein
VPGAGSEGRTRRMRLGFRGAATPISTRSSRATPALSRKSSASLEHFGEGLPPGGPPRLQKRNGSLNRALGGNTIGSIVGQTSSSFRRVDVDALGNAAEVWSSLGTVKTEYDVPATRDPLGARDRSSRSPGARVPGPALGSRACALPRERLGRFGEKAAGANS